MSNGRRVIRQIHSNPSTFSNGDKDSQPFEDPFEDLFEHARFEGAGLRDCQRTGTRTPFERSFEHHEVIGGEQVREECSNVRNENHARHIAELSMGPSGRTDAAGPVPNSFFANSVGNIPTVSPWDGWVCRVAGGGRCERAAAPGWSPLSTVSRLLDRFAL
jgi:hypothetical protein